MYHNNTRRIITLLIVIMATGCAGISRKCSSCWAKNIGADWLVVELREMDGAPYRCWELKGVSLDNEENSDGIYWKDGGTGNLIHISGSYDYIQVKSNNWDAAYSFFGLTRESCRLIRDSIYNPRTGKYEPPAE